MNPKEALQSQPQTGHPELLHTCLLFPLVAFQFHSPQQSVHAVHRSPQTLYFIPTALIFLDPIHNPQIHAL